MEEATAVSKLKEMTGASIRELAERLGKSKTWVENRLKLARTYENKELTVPPWDSMNPEPKCEGIEEEAPSAGEKEDHQLHTAHNPPIDESLPLTTTLEIMKIPDENKRLELIEEAKERSLTRDSVKKIVDVLKSNPEIEIVSAVESQERLRDFTRRWGELKRRWSAHYDINGLLASETFSEVPLLPDHTWTLKTFDDPEMIEHLLSGSYADLILGKLEFFESEEGTKVVVSAHERTKSRVAREYSNCEELVTIRQNLSRFLKSRGFPHQRILQLLKEVELSQIASPERVSDTRRKLIRERVSELIEMVQSGEVKLSEGGDGELKNATLNEVNGNVILTKEEEETSHDVSRSPTPDSRSPESRLFESFALRLSHLLESIQDLLGILDDSSKEVLISYWVEKATYEEREKVLAKVKAIRWGMEEINGHLNEILLS